MTECFLARTAPCAPDIQEHELALIRFENLLQQRLALREVCKVVGRLEHQLVELAVLDGKVVIVLLLDHRNKLGIAHQRLHCVNHLSRLRCTKLVNRFVYLL